MISGKAYDIKQIYEKVIEANKEVKDLILLSYEGLVMVSTLETGMFEDCVSAMAAGTNSMLSRFLRDIELGTFTFFLTTTPKGNILVKNVEDVGLLVVMTQMGVDWKKMHYHVNWIISKITSMNET